MSTTPSFLSDSPSKIDSLGRLPFAKALARTLVLPEGSEGLVVGIEASWGAGKSTLIELIKIELASTPNVPAPLLVTFNPWTIGATGALIEALISQIAVAIDADTSTGEKGVKAGQTLLTYLGVFSKLKYLKYVPGGGWAGEIAGLLAEIAEQTEKTKQAGDKALKEIKELLPKLDLAKQKKKVIEALKELNRPIIIIVDDMDRLLPAEIQSMVQAIKAVADFPRTTYLLAYDRKIVAEALGRDQAAGISYLEKIVQVAYPIPPLFNRQRGKLARQQIQAFLDSREIKLRDFETTLLPDGISILARLLPQPRDVVRLINRLALSIPATLPEVNVIDVIVFEALSMKHPSVRDAIHKHTKDFVAALRDDEVHLAERRFHPVQLTTSGRPDASSWTQHIPPDDAAVVAACEFLFAYNGNRREHFRLSDPDRLARLFRMTSLEGVPEISELHGMLRDPALLEAALADCDADESSALLDWIGHYLSSCERPDKSGAVRIIVEHARRLERAGVLNTTLIWRTSWAIGVLTERGDTEAAALYEWIIDVAPLEIAEETVKTAYSDHERGRHRYEFSPEADQAINRFIGRVREWSENGASGDGRFIQDILHTFRMFSPSDTEVYEMVERLSLNNEWLHRFLSGFRADAGNDRGLKLIGNPEELAVRIERSEEFSARYSWMIQSLRSRAAAPQRG